MLKLNASYSKKVPAEGEYSSQQYHCQIEVELPDGLTSQQLQEKVHGVFAFVRASVESELRGAPTPAQAAMPANAIQAQQGNGSAQLPPAQQPMAQQQPMPQPMPQSQPMPQAQSQYRNGGNGLASAKQRNYLLALAKRAGWTVQQILQHCQIASMEQMPSRTCSQLIEQFSGQAA